MAAKRTPWFPFSTPPVRPGLYETRIGHYEILLRRWTGGGWTYPNGRVSSFFACGPNGMNDQWRGLTKPAKG